MQIRLRLIEKQFGEINDELAACENHKRTISLLKLNNKLVAERVRIERQLNGI